MYKLFKFALFGNSVMSLEKEGKNLLGIFTGTVEGLKHLNEKILALRKYHAERVQQHQQSHDTLLNQEAQNNSVIEKINQILAV